MTTNNELAPTQSNGLVFTDEQKRILLDSFANGASEVEFAALCEVAQRRNLDPFKREIFFVQRWDSNKNRMVWATQVSIDGLRLVAERSGLYAGQDEPEFEERDGAPVLCKVRVWRKDWPRPAVGVARWSEYVQTTRDKQSGQTRANAMWQKMPHTMLSKCAEALAIRKAFPESAAGLYTADEMGQADNDTPQPTRIVDVRPERPQLDAPATTAQEPPQRPANPLPALGIEAPPKRPQNAAETSAQRDHIREATAYVGGDNPTLGEHSHAVAEAQTMPAAPAWRVALDALHESAPDLIAYCNDTERASLPGDCVDVWMKHRADLASLAAPVREAAWKALCARCEEVGRMRNAKVWMKKNIAERDAAKAAQTDAPAATETP